MPKCTFPKCKCNLENNGRHRCTRQAFEYESVPRSKVAAKLREGWVIVNPTVEMAPIEYADDDLRAGAGG